jgi:hypothetical protein
MGMTRAEVVEVLPTLFKFLHSNRQNRNHILENTSEPLVRCLAKCAYRFLKKGCLLSQSGSGICNISVGGNHKNHLRKLRVEKKKLIALADPVVSNEKKRKILQKGSGAFLAPLISLGIPFLLSLLSK